MSYDKDKLAEIFAQVAYYSGLGFIMPAGLAGGYVLGWYLDSKFRTSPVFTIIFAAIGAVGGVIEVIRIILREEKIEERRNSGGRPRQG